MRPTLLALVGAMLLLGACTSPEVRAPSHAGSTGATPSVTRRAGWSSSGTASAGARAGVSASSWHISARRAGGIEGFANRVSVLPGERLTLYVSTPAHRFRVRAFRMGWYGGAEGRQLWLSPWVAAHEQSRAVLLAAATGTMTANWRPSIAFSTTGWQPGDYLLRLEASTGHMAFVPLAVRTQSARGRVVLVNAVTTWQAYNSWGCCDLYAGGDGSFVSRSRAVTFDRPYLKENGAGGFIRGELGIVAEADRLGLPVDNVTDTDLQADPDLLLGARAVVSMGHDEYWSPQMRAAVTAARDRGTNLAFFGANAVFRRIRFGSTAIGPNRLEINYKVASEDPLNGVDDAAVTADWPAPPDANPESALLGAQYGCFFGTGVPNRPGVVTAPANWIYAGTGVRLGTRLPGLIGPEIDAIQPSYPTPHPIISIMHSPAACSNGSPGFADASYYVARSGAAVFDAGSIAWACNVAPRCAGTTYRPTHAVVRRATDNILRAFAEGPAGRIHPAN